MISNKITILSKKILPVLLISSMVFIYWWRREDIEKHTIYLNHFDTMIEIIFYTKDDELIEKKMNDEMDSLFIEMNRVFSSYDSRSELSGINEYCFKRRVSKDIKKVIKHSLVLYKQSNGAFDITVKPLLELWDFKKKIVPSKEKIDSVLNTIGSDKIHLSNDTLYKKVPQLKIDLGAISKGYIIDKAVEYLKSRKNITGGLVNIGGDLKLFGEKTKGDAIWKIGIMNPRKNNEIWETLDVPSGFAVTTSGDYFRYFIGQDGIRYSHIIDPSTGKPVEKELVSVTIVGPLSGMTDGIATTLFVLGKDKGIEFMEKYYPAYSYYLIYFENEQLKTYSNLKSIEKK